MDESIASKNSARTFWTTEDIRNKVEKEKVVVFAKGSLVRPRDGYSEQAFSAMNDCGKPFEVVDVSEDSSILSALRAYAGRVSLPVVYINGTLVSNSETLQRMLESGELKTKLEKAFT